MVTAGVFLLLRLSILLASSYYSLLLIVIIGGLTAFIGGSLAIVSLDLKELIAYSTMSQLGYMVTILGLKHSHLSFFHLVFHAYFKALLFLTAGAILHTILDLQDLRKTGGLLKFLPLYSIVIIIGLTSLTGFPFTTGFYSKEAILNHAYSYNNNFNYTLINKSYLFDKFEPLTEYINNITLYKNIFNNNLLLGEYAYLILLITALLTIGYSYRFFIYLFLGENKLSIFCLKHLHFASLHLIISLFLLSIFTIFIGFIFSKYNLFMNIPFNYLTVNIPL